MRPPVQFYIQDRTRYCAVTEREGDHLDRQRDRGYERICCVGSDLGERWEVHFHSRGKEEFSRTGGDAMSASSGKCKGQR